MAKTSYQFDLPLVSPRADEPLSAWLYRELRAGILEGRLQPGLKLPPTRTFAAQHRVARGTITRVFEQLVSEGYLVSRVGSGTCVSRELPEQHHNPAPTPKKLMQASVRGTISPRGKILAHSPFLSLSGERGVRAFRANEPSLDHFPIETWSRLASRRTRMASREMLRAGDPLGYLPLREAIAAHLGSTRGVLCTAPQIMIVSGTQQALDLVARSVLSPGDEMWMEDPGYVGAVPILRAAGVKLVPVPVDERGLQVNEGVRRAPKARLAYVTPAHQFPLCVTMSLERRLQLLAWSRKTGSWIFEDDYDSEFRFAGRPLAAMQGLAPEGNVIFSGSFSKMLFPSLRMGFLVLPEHLVEPLRHARSILDRYGPMLEQAILGDFIAEGHFSRHLRRMRQVYAENLQLLVQGAAAEWGDRLTVQPTDTGLQTVGWLAKGWTDAAFARTASGLGVEVMPLSPFALRWKKRNGLQIGFGAVRPSELQRGIHVLGQILRNKNRQ